MSARKIRQFAGPSRHYPAACIELTFAAPSAPVPFAGLAEACSSLPHWQEELLAVLPVEEAIARIGRHFIARHVPVWSRFRREQADGVVALGTFDGKLTGLLLATLERALLGSPDEQAQALGQLGKLDALISGQRSINWALIDAARRLGVESHWIVPSEQIYQLGIGASGRHFLQLTNSADAATGWIIAKNKDHTVNTLRLHGFPTTRGMLVRNGRDAPAAIKQIGFPSVVKPLRLGKGQGITTGITNQADLEAAIRQAIAAESSPVLVENHVDGGDHRLMVVEGEVLWAYSKVPASVTGDGKSTVRALIEAENRRRRDTKQGKLTLLEQIKFTDGLARFLSRRYGVGLDHVLERGTRIELAGQSNISLGGILSEVTSQLHADNRQLAIDVAAALRLSVLGVDFLTPDIGRSWKEVECAVIEVNCTPGLSGTGDAALAVRSLFPNRCSGRIPVLAALGGADFRTATAERLLAAATRAGARGQLVEWSVEERARRVTATGRPAALARTMLDRHVEALIVSCDPAAIEARGFPLLHADLIVAEDPDACSFLAPIADEIAPLAQGVGLAKKVATIVAKYAGGEEGGARPTLTLHASGGQCIVECLRFRALPRAWFRPALGLPAQTEAGMLDFADLFAAIESLAKVSIAFEPPAPGWQTVSVEGVVAVPKGTSDALAAAVETINALIAKGPD
jgi:D-alanine-D-alanine ligase-like ATP-grasp enzyme